MEGATATGMMTHVTNALTSVIGAIGDVVSAIVTENGELNALVELLAIGVAISLFFVGVKAIRSIIWGA